MGYNEKCACKRIKRKVDVIQEILVKLSNSLKIDISEFDNNQQSSSDDDDEDDDDTLVGHSKSEERASGNGQNDWSEKTDGWGYENTNQLTALNIQSRNPEQRFWSANKAAINEGYQFEDMESGISRNARCSIRGRPSSAHKSSAHGELQKRERRSNNIYQPNREDEFTFDSPRESDPIGYRQAHDDTDSYGSRAERKQLRTEVYQKRLRGAGEKSYSDARRESILSREMPSDTMSLQQFDSRLRTSHRTNPRAEVRRVESMPSRPRDNISPPRRRRETHSHRAKRNSPESIRMDSFRRQVAERRRDMEETSFHENPERLVD